MSRRGVGQVADRAGVGRDGNPDRPAEGAQELPPVLSETLFRDPFPLDPPVLPYWQAGVYFRPVTLTIPSF